MLALLITGATMLVSCKDDDEKAVSEDEIAKDWYKYPAAGKVFHVE